MKTLKNREIAHKFHNGWEAGKVKGVEKIDEFVVFYQSHNQLGPKQERLRGRQKLGCFSRKK